MSARTHVWNITGMFCPHCQKTITLAVEMLPGLSNVQVDYQTGTLRALWDPAITSEAELADCLKEAGYELVKHKARQSIYYAIGLFAVLLLIWGSLMTPLGGRLYRTISSFPIAKEGMGYGALFLLGLMTSLHCASMCGGIVIGKSASAAQSGNSASVSVILYNSGRIIAYTVIGGITGALGGIFSISTTAKAAIQLMASAFMLVMALNLLGGPAFLRRIQLRLPAGVLLGISRMSARIHAFFASGVPENVSNTGSSFIIGLLNGLMPCGPLQAMQLFSLSTGSWWKGSLSMLCFALGTVPLMSAVGFLSGKLNKTFAKPMRMISATFVAIMGISMLSNGISLLGGRIPYVETSTGTSAGETVEAEIIDGMQYVTTELDYGAYPPIIVVSGIPVKWNLHVVEKKLNGCNNAIVIPAYNIELTLQPGDNYIFFTPTEEGVVSYTCWMGMIHSSITVKNE